MEYVSLTDIGKRRDLNEDSYSKLETDKFILFVVCDGMGGHQAGEVASSEAVKSLIDFAKDNKDCENLEDLLKDGVARANERVYEKSLDDKSYNNMGTTLVSCIIQKDSITIANVGDSRLYLYRKGDLKQVTVDHSLVNDLLTSGTISEEEAKDFKQKNVITRSLGIEEDIEVDIYKMKLEAKDIILLCTDGLSSQLDDEEIKEILAEDISLEERAKNFIEKANDNGGIDNVTITLYEHESENSDD